MRVWGCFLEKLALEKSSLTSHASANPYTFRLVLLQIHASRSYDNVWYHTLSWSLFGLVLADILFGPAQLLFQWKREEASFVDSSIFSFSRGEKSRTFVAQPNWAFIWFSHSVAMSQLIKGNTSNFSTKDTVVWVRPGTLYNLFLSSVHVSETCLQKKQDQR